MIKYRIDGEGSNIRIFKLTEKQSDFFVSEDLSPYDAVAYCEENPIEEVCGWFGPFIDTAKLTDISISNPEEIDSTDIDIVGEPDPRTIEFKHEAGIYLVSIDIERGYWGTIELPESKKGLEVITYYFLFCDDEYGINDVFSHFELNSKTINADMDDWQTETRAQSYYILELDNEGNHVSLEYIFEKIR